MIRAYDLNWAESRLDGPGQERATADVPGFQPECPVSTLLRGKVDGRLPPHQRTYEAQAATAESAVRLPGPRRLMRPACCRRAACDLRPR